MTTWSVQFRWRSPQRMNRPTPFAPKATWKDSDIIACNQITNQRIRLAISITAMICSSLSCGSLAPQRFVLPTVRRLNTKLIVLRAKPRRIINFTPPQALCLFIHGGGSEAPLSCALAPKQQKQADEGVEVEGASERSEGVAQSREPEEVRRTALAACFCCEATDKERNIN